MSLITITTHTVGKLVEVDFGALYGNPATPFVKSPKTYFPKGCIAEFSPRTDFFRIVTVLGDRYDLAHDMIDSVDGTPITTKEEMEAAIINIIANNLI